MLHTCVRSSEIYREGICMYLNFWGAQTVDVLSFKNCFSEFGSRKVRLFDSCDALKQEEAS